MSPGGSSTTASTHLFTHVNTFVHTRSPSTCVVPRVARHSGDNGIPAELLQALAEMAEGLGLVHSVLW